MTDFFYLNRIFAQFYKNSQNILIHNNLLFLPKIEYEICFNIAEIEYEICFNIAQTLATLAENFKDLSYYEKKILRLSTRINGNDN